MATTARFPIEKVKQATFSVRNYIFSQVYEISESGSDIRNVIPSLEFKT